jgi:APA family basic amino acid/polyamine antiporter
MFWGDGIASTLALFAFFSGFGALNGWILLQAEMPRVLANDGVFPKVFARESRHGTPGASLVITSLLLTTLVLMNYSRSMVQVFTFIILISTSTYLVMYLCCALAALKLCWAGSLGAQGRRLSPFLLIALLASAYSLWTLFGAGAEEFWWSMALFAVGLPVHWLMRRPGTAARAGAPPF